MRENDWIVSEVLEDSTDGLNRSEIARQTGLDEKEVGRALNRLKQKGLVRSNDDDQANRRAQRVWVSTWPEFGRATQLIVNARLCQPMRRAVPFSVFHHHLGGT